MGANPIKIKDVGRREIWMDESKVGVHTLKSYLTWIIILGVFPISIFANFITPPLFSDITLFIMIVGLILITVGSMVNSVFQYGMKWEPAYEIYVRGDRSATKTIRRVDPDTDAANVCRAAKELEATALALSKTEYEMEQIALKCK